MFTATHPAVSERYNEHFESARSVSTFMHSRFEDVGAMLKKLREAYLPYGTVIARADKTLLDMPVLLLKNDRINRVLVKSPSGIWIEVTEATANEVADLSMGLVGPQVPPKTGDEVLGEAIGNLVGFALLATLGGLSKSNRRESLDRRHRRY
jgi:hypothetical protein